jgi:hypothetical protein
MEARLESKALPNTGEDSHPGGAEASRPGPNMTAARATVLSFAVFVALLVLLSAFCTPRNGDIDELGLYNPPYMLAHFGTLNYPIYGVYKSTIVHPPVHVGFIGLLNRWGFTWYYAEAAPTVLFFLISIVVIVTGAFPPAVQLGLLFSIGVVVGLPVDLFTTRPDGHVEAAWFAGLVFLESARLDRWKAGKLFAGAFCLAWASGVHYYAVAAQLGVVVYAAWALASLGWKQAKWKMVALAGGACLFGIPYVAFYLVPNAGAIVGFLRLAGAAGDVKSSIANHEQIYSLWGHGTYFPVWLRAAFLTRVPLVVYATPILFAIPSTRVLSIAALPIELFVLLLSNHKQGVYLIHEMALLAAAAGCGAAVLAAWVVRRVPWRFATSLFFPLIAAALAYNLYASSRTVPVASVSIRPRIHEGDLARAALRKILGLHASVGSRMCLWYASGADHWHDVAPDLMWYPKMRFDPRGYFENFDAIAEDQHMSYATANQLPATLSSWYADGVLKLRAFFLGETNEQLRILLFSAKAPGQLTGYAVRAGELYRFEQYADGDYVLDSSVCELNAAQRFRARAPFTALLYLPGAKTGEAAPDVVLTVLAPTHGDSLLSDIAKTCRNLTRISGSIFLDNSEALVDWLRATDTPMHFDRDLKTVPTYTGAGLLDASGAGQ